MTAAGDHDVAAQLQAEAVTHNLLDDSLLAEYSQHRSQLEEELDDESLLKAKVRVRDKSEN